MRRGSLARRYLIVLVALVTGALVTGGAIQLRASYLENQAALVALQREKAVGTERDPDNVAPLVVFLSSDQAASINGQVFHSFGYGYTLLAQPQAIRRIEGNRRLTPEELAKLWGDTMGKEPKAPYGTAFGRTLNERPANEWKDVENGVRAWKWGYGEP